MSLRREERAMGRRAVRELTCEKCGALFSAKIVTNGVIRDLYDRRFCTDCVPLVPHKPRTQRQVRVPRPVAVKICEACGRVFAVRQLIDGKLRPLYRRRFCFSCSPFGSHNTSKHPPGIPLPEELKEHRRRRRNAKTYRYQKKRRRRIKAELIRARGGQCQGCGYSVSVAALEFHHRDPATKEFGVGNFSGSLARLLAEAAKCDLLCANCHRLRHAVADAARTSSPKVEHRRRRKIRAVAYMGGACFACGWRGPAAVFEFHHRDASEKDFGISQTGTPHRWEKVVAELAKCVMLCANCHREVHAGVRELDEGLLGLAKESGPYAAIAV
jgi:hypothetical protein